ncbi:uncharacterized protein STEHIDRAFT_159779 [Stereum hirsutum FP-91666 SS1]|uniref:uncharacterized protein n=1 Tax=Stereum hirsutum (strain FP-91666) TaxID=721885 RepID=UPI000444A4D0|nr:uncharacterized protein STEHIDRAFT_159779 [Stereum hirsutum FP-91666 SS1]EIM83182.1 hypothetical protein STEHIDRAFT_159779 [Stereum hirsutum FP-91666 SS1]
MSAIYVIVDDRDPSISYGPTDGNWTDSGVDIEFLSTTTQSTGVGSTMEVSFSGKSVFAFGSLGGSTDPQTVNVTFTIDGGVSSSSILTPRRDSSHHISAFNVTSLEDTTHSINMDISGQFASQLFLDYIVIEATENSTISHPSTSRIFIDDTSPYLSWSGDWAVATPPWIAFNDSFTEVDGTFNGSVTGGATPGASMTLNFIGTSVDVYGISIAISAPPASYTIDDSIPFNVTMPENIGDISPAVNWHYISAPLSSGGNHTLVVTCEVANSFYIDYVLVGSDTAFVPPPTAVEKRGGTPATTPSSSTDKEQNKYGVIVGGVVGAASLVVILVLGVFLWRCRRRSRRRHINGQSVQDDESPGRLMMNWVTPFSLARPTVSSMRAPKDTQQGAVARLECSEEAGTPRMIPSQSPPNISEAAARTGQVDGSVEDSLTTMPPVYTA